MIYEKVEEIRKEKGVTKTHLAKKLGISLQAYVHITNGNSRLDVERLKIIAFELGVEPSIFFDTKLTKSVI